MAEDKPGVRDPMMSVLAVAVAVLFVFVLLLSRRPVECSVPSDLEIKYDEIADTHWTCVDAKCNRVYTPQEWMARYCSPQGETTVCNVVMANGQPAQVPLNQLNVSAIRECAEYVCTQEGLVRNTTYILPTP